MIIMNGIYDLRVDIDRIEYFESIEDNEKVEEYKNIIINHVKDIVRENEDCIENQEIKAFISKEIFAKMSDQSAACVLRKILFADKNNIINWNAARAYILENMPELKGKI